MTSNVSDYPADYVPKDAEIIVGVDYGSGDQCCIVKGFYDPKTREFHIQDMNQSALAPENKRGKL